MEVVQHTIGSTYGIILLAAGVSSRLGQPKQLLNYRGQSLLRNAASTAVAVGAGATVVVLGAEVEQMQRELKDLRVKAVYNQDYQEGMASSICCGLRYVIENHDDVEHVIFMVCDQPFVDSSHLLSMVDMHQRSGSSVVASFYAGRKGVPALFHRHIFPELLALEGDIGAKQIIERYSDDCAIVPLSLGHIDIDTPDAYKWLNEQQ